MSCPCDQNVFPPPLAIRAGLASLPRQIATFPEFRSAMLSAIPGQAPLTGWRARGGDDFGIMLLEMWSYVCDCISFYDEGIANECYVRTSMLRPSVRKLVGLLGYVPRPATGARVDLAILADGRLPLVLPAGTGFRSGGFPGGTPQVFELDNDSRVHPFLNQTTLARSRPATLEPGPIFTFSRDTLLLDPSTARLKADQLVFIEDLSNTANSRVRTVNSIANFAASDGATYKQAVFSAFLPIPGWTAVTDVQITTPSQTGTIFQQPIYTLSGGLYISVRGPVLIFDTVQRQIQLGDTLVLDKAGDYRWFSVVYMEEAFVALPSTGSTTVTDSNNNVTTVTPPAPQVQVTWVILDMDFNDPSRREGVTPNWTDADAKSIKVHFGFRKAGDAITPMNLTLQPGDAMTLAPPYETPQDGKFPSLFLLQDNDTVGAEIAGSVDFAAGTLTPSQPLTEALAAPVTVYANVVTASRGETVAGELLGSGDSSVANQAFQLKKAPLTYFAAPEGPQSTLKVYVNGLQWTEQPSFFGMAGDAQVYIVRQDDDGDSLVIFGDGIRGLRPPTGASIVAYYRNGAGLLSPPAGSITQMAKPVKGITSVRNPVAASGGDDAEPASGMQTYAPQSALLLGRAISIPDMEAAAATVGGVRALRAEWRWNTLQQRPVVEIWYIGAASVKGDVLTTLRGLSDGVTPIAVDQATSVPSTLSISIEIDPKMQEDDVVTAVRTALMDPDTGLLPPEQIGIGLPLFRSRIFEAVLATPGAIAVTGLLWNGGPFDAYGLDPGAGQYFDLESGALILNGKAA
jgi:predicted phage baseplate assembly protein